MPNTIGVSRASSGASGLGDDEMIMREPHAALSLALSCSLSFQCTLD